MHSRLFRLYVIPTLAVLVVGYLLLLLPPKTPVIVPSDVRRSFEWRQDGRWEQLERLFITLRPGGCAAGESVLRTGFRLTDSLIRAGETLRLAAADTLFSRLESTALGLAPYVAACSDSFPAYLTTIMRLRTMVKAQSTGWSMDDGATRDRLYRLLYGTRMATEEVMLQSPDSLIPPVVRVADVPSNAPSDTLLGVVIHSGDILVSRGSFPTSALIARGNDYQGNFSHVALVYIDSVTHRTSLIESHIEKGVAIATVSQYLADTKLRIMLLRLRPDLRVLQSDPLAAHHAAERMYRRATEGHIAYDFQMDVQDSALLFCSEVASSAYRQVGIRLWMGISRITAPGVRRWLGSFGVSHFETQEPSDLEYDPQLAVVAEWRDPARLFRDHVDNAVIDAMLEQADSGTVIPFKWPMLPVARVLKAYSALLNAAGCVGPIPEGMPAAAALRNEALTSRHRKCVQILLDRTENFRADQGYTPPYWKLLAMARQVVQEVPF